MRGRRCTSNLPVSLLKPTWYSWRKEMGAEMGVSFPGEEVNRAETAPTFFLNHPPSIVCARKKS